MAGRVFVCRRGAARPRQKPVPCRWPGCDRYASQARWCCKIHWFRLPPALRDRLWRAASMIAHGFSTSPAWQAVAAEADTYAAEREAAGPRADRRQPELPL